MNESDQTVLSSACPEQFIETRPDDIIVWVDPLDGTSEYTQVGIILIWFWICNL